MKLEQAQAIVRTVVAEAPGPVSVFVADRGGELVAAATMDDAAPDTRLNAQRKAYTAARAAMRSRRGHSRRSSARSRRRSSPASTRSSRSSSAGSPRSKATGASVRSASAGCRAPMTTRWRGRRSPTLGWRRDEARADVDGEHQPRAARGDARRRRDRRRRQPRRRQGAGVCGGARDRSFARQLRGPPRRRRARRRLHLAAERDAPRVDAEGDRGGQARARREAVFAPRRRGGGGLGRGRPRGPSS